MSSLQDILELAIRRLVKAGCDMPRLDAELLLAQAIGQDRVWLHLHPSTILDEDQRNGFETLLKRRERREPVAYISGYKAFFGLEFQVSPQVLIPRPETELLVETALQFVKLPVATPVSIADVGTGSGCIAIALAKNLADVSIFALDVSETALQLAQQNAARHEVTTKITFLVGDLLQPLTGPVDLIVSNPPYVSQSELKAASPEVNQYEPRRALDGGRDGLEIIRRLLPQVKEKLKPNGNLLVEIGATQGQVVAELARTHFPRANIRIDRDLAGLDRLLVAQMD